MAGRYNIVVIGGGSGGLVVAAGAGLLGAKAALIEKERLGGDCLWFGCVPSKAVLRSGKVAALARQAAEFGVQVGEVRVDFAAVMDRMRRLRGVIEVHDSPERFRSFGAEVVFGSPRFLDAGTIELTAPDGTRTEYRARSFCIATGSRPVAPPIDGLEEAGYLTNVSVFGLTAMPQRLAVVGAGPIGLELAQFFRRCGAEVTVLEALDRILPRDDPECAGILRQVLEREGVAIHTSAKILHARKDGADKRLRFEREGRAHEIAVDEILVAAGRAPNVEGLDLEKAGVHFSRRGIEVDERMRTSTPHIYACGDVTGLFPFTHSAEAAAKVVLRNALFPLRAKMDWQSVAWSTFTDPEVAHLGATEQELEQRGIAYEVYRHELDHEDRAIVDGQADGLIKILVGSRGRILGAHLCAPEAGELIQELTLAMSRGLPIGSISSAIHIYPTMVRAVRQAADQSFRSSLTEGRKRLLARYFAWRR